MPVRYSTFNNSIRGTTNNIQYTVYTYIFYIVEDLDCNEFAPAA